MMVCLIDVSRSVWSPPPRWAFMIESQISKPTCFSLSRTGPEPDGSLTVAWRLTCPKCQPKSTGMWLGAAWLLVFSLLAAPQKGQPRENRGVAPSVAPSRMFAGFLAGFALTVAWRLTCPKCQPKSTGMWLGALRGFPACGALIVAQCCRSKSNASDGGAAESSIPTHSS